MVIMYISPPDGGLLQDHSERTLCKENRQGQNHEHQKLALLLEVSEDPLNPDHPSSSLLLAWINQPDVLQSQSSSGLPQPRVERHLGNESRPVVESQRLGNQSVARAARLRRHRIYHEEASRSRRRQQRPPPVRTCPGASARPATCDARANRWSPSLRSLKPT